MKLMKGTSQNSKRARNQNKQKPTVHLISNPGSHESKPSKPKPLSSPRCHENHQHEGPISCEDQTQSHNPRLAISESIRQK